MDSTINEHDIDYDNLDFCLNLWHNFSNDEIKTQYVFGQISKKNITQQNLKKSPKFDPEHVFNNSIKYTGFYNGRLHYKRKSKVSFPCELTFGFYHDDNIDSLKNGPLHDIALMYMGSELVAQEKFKHITIPIMMFDVEKDYVEKKIQSFKKDLENNFDKETINRKLYCIITERYYKSQTLSAFLTKNINNFTEETWKILFFQIIYSLYKLNTAFKNFRHNNLNLESIKIFTKKSPEKSVYIIGSTKMTINNVQTDIKLSDFQYFTSSDYIENNLVPNPSIDHQYDIIYFFNSLREWIKNGNYDIPKSVKLFIHRISPENILKENNIDQERRFPVEYSIPIMILTKNNFFGDFITTDALTSSEGGSYSPLSELIIPIENIIDEKSITESSLESPRLLAKKMHPKIKKSESYYNNAMKNHGKNIRKKSNSSKKKQSPLQSSSSDSTDSMELSQSSEKIFNRAEKISNESSSKRKKELSEKYEGPSIFTESEKSEDYSKFFKAIGEIGNRSSKSHDMKKREKITKNKSKSNKIIDDEEHSSSHKGKKHNKKRYDDEDMEESKPNRNVKSKKSRERDNSSSNNEDMEESKPNRNVKSKKSRERDNSSSNNEDMEESKPNRNVKSKKSRERDNSSSNNEDMEESKPNRNVKSKKSRERDSSSNSSSSDDEEISNIIKIGMGKQNYNIPETLEGMLNQNGNSMGIHAKKNVPNDKYTPPNYTPLFNNQHLPQLNQMNLHKMNNVANTFPNIGQMNNFEHNMPQYESNYMPQYESNYMPQHEPQYDANYMAQHDANYMAQHDANYMAQYESNVHQYKPNNMQMNLMGQNQGIGSKYNMQYSPVPMMQNVNARNEYQLSGNQYNNLSNVMDNSRYESSYFGNNHMNQGYMNMQMNDNNFKTLSPMIDNLFKNNMNEVGLVGGANVDNLSDYDKFNLEDDDDGLKTLDQKIIGNNFFF
jgi:hypothetical protein